jgi:sulfate adenylyltransferase subunit 2
VYSHRDSFGQWDPKNQRPELWGIYNGRHKPGEHFRIFPLSNWTELDIWTFIAEHHIDLPSIYFAHKRPVFLRDGMWMAVTDFLQPEAGEEVVDKMVRFRTVGDATCTAAIESVAVAVDDIIAETAVARVTERGATRADDRMSEAGMEDRKRTGYF